MKCNKCGRDVYATIDCPILKDRFCFDCHNTKKLMGECQHDE